MIIDWFKTLFDATGFQTAADAAHGRNRLYNSMYYQIA